MNAGGANARAIDNVKPLYVSLFMDRNTRLQMRLMRPAAYGRAPHMLQPLQSFPVFPGMMAGGLYGGQQFFQNRWVRPVGHMLPAQGRMAIWPPRAAAAAPPARPAEQQKAVFQQQARNIPSAAPAAPVAPVAAAPAPNKNDLAAMLAQATPQDQKQMLGERLYVLITPTHAQLAGKITAMLLDGLDTAELLGVIESRAALDKNIKLAVDALQQHSKKG
jgi:polyadenylate-binding protein